MVDVKDKGSLCRLGEQWGMILYAGGCDAEESEKQVRVLMALDQDAYYGFCRKVCRELDAAYGRILERAQ